MSALSIALLVIGAALLVAEAHVVSYGVLGTLGIAALCGGVALAASSAGLGAVVAVALTLALALVLLGGLVFAGTRVRRVHRRRPLGGAEGLVGRVGVVRSDVTPVGDVCVRGELWRARRSDWEDEDVVLRAGEPVVVERVRGLTVSVRHAEEWELLP